MAASIDQQFIEYIVKSIVGQPDAVKVERTIDEKGVLLELTVDAEDLGRVIGKRGATAQSLRTLLRALGTKNDARYNLKIVDVGGPRPPRDTPSGTPVATTDDEDTAAGPANEPADTAAGPADVTPAEEIAKEEKESNLAARTRAELADLDDLDV